MKHQNKLIILNGVAGAGKSTYAETLKEEYGHDCVIGLDQIREMCGAIKRDDEGKALYISPQIDPMISHLFYEIISLRMQQGASIVCDCTFCSANSMQKLKILSKIYRYDVELHRIECPLDILLERNKARGYKNVPEEVVRKMYKKFKEQKMEDWYNVIVHPYEEQLKK